MVTGEANASADVFWRSKDGYAGPLFNVAQSGVVGHLGSLPLEAMPRSFQELCTKVTLGTPTYRRRHVYG